jgi:hypothetical protein
LIGAILMGQDRDLVEPLHIETFTFPGFPDIEHRLPYLIPRQLLYVLRGAADDYLVAAEVHFSRNCEIA